MWRTASRVPTPGSTSGLDRKSTPSTPDSLDEVADFTENQLRRNMAAVERLLRSPESSDEDQRSAARKRKPVPGTTPRATTEQILRRRQVMFDSDEDDTPVKRSAKGSKSNSAIKINAAIGLSPRPSSALKAESQAVPISRSRNLAKLWNQDDAPGFRRFDEKSQIEQNDRRDEQLGSGSKLPPPPSARMEDGLRKEQRQGLSPAKKIPWQTSGPQDVAVKSNTARTQPDSRETNPTIRKSSAMITRDAMASEATPIKSRNQTPLSSDGGKVKNVKASGGRRPLSRNQSHGNSGSDSDSDSDELERIAGHRARVAILSAPSTPRGTTFVQPASLTNSRGGSTDVAEDKKLPMQTVKKLQKEVKSLQNQLAAQQQVSDRQAQMLSMEVAQAQDELLYLKSVIHSLEQKLIGMGATPRFQFTGNQKTKYEAENILNTSRMVLSADVVIDHGAEITTLRSQTDRAWENRVKGTESDSSFRRVNLADLNHQPLVSLGDSDSHPPSAASRFALHPDSMASAGADPHAISNSNGTQCYPSQSDGTAKLRVVVKEVQNLPKLEKWRACNPFAVASLGRYQQFQTDVVRNSNSAKWGTEFEFSVGAADEDNLKVELFDNFDEGKISFIGSARFGLKELLDPQRGLLTSVILEKSVPLLDRTDKIVLGTDNQMAIITVAITKAQDNSTESAQADAFRSKKVGEAEADPTTKRSHGSSTTHKEVNQHPFESVGSISSASRILSVKPPNVVPADFPNTSFETESSKDDDANHHIVHKFSNPVEMLAFNPLARSGRDRRRDVDASSGAARGVHDADNSPDDADDAVPGLASNESFEEGRGHDGESEPAPNLAHGDAQQPVALLPNYRPVPVDGAGWPGQAAAHGHGPSRPQAVDSPRRNPSPSSLSSGSVRASPVRRVLKSVSICREPLSGSNPSQADRIGIGISFGVTVRGDFFITGMAANGPAMASGQIKRGDKLLAVDGTRVTGLAVNDVVQSIIGVRGTVVTLDLAVLPDGGQTP